MINRVVLVGRITRDPETQQTNAGIPYVRFTVAVNRPFKDQNGERPADFINCIAWRAQAEFLQKFVKKGNQLAVEGRIQTNSYTDANGNNRQAFDILVESVSNLEPASKNDGYQPQPPFGNGFQPVSQPVSQPETNHQEFEVSDDDLPF
jgi:single-strand DNA-binding protein